MFHPTPSRRGLCAVVSVFALILTPGLATAQHPDCRPPSDWQGPPPVDQPEVLNALPRPVSPAEHAMNAALAERLDVAADYIAERVPAASLAVSGPATGLWTASPGTTPDRRFAAASIGKSMTAALIFQLEAEGRLSRHDTVDQWFPDLPLADQVTLDQLLRHTSGYLVPATAPLSGPYRAPEADLERLVQTGPAFCPGTNWAYSNIGYQLLGLIVERVEERPFADVFETRLLIPLGLTGTHVFRPGEPDPALVQGHEGGQPVAGIDYATPHAAGPVSTTATDLVRWMEALLSGRVVSPEALDLMLGPMTPMFGREDMAYGRGLQLYRVEGPGVMMGHSGGVTGFTAVVAWLAEDDVVVAVLLNDRQVPAEAALWHLVRALRGE